MESGFDDVWRRGSLNGPQVASIDDKKDFKTVNDAFRAIGFPKDDINSIWNMVAAILHLVRELIQVSSRLSKWRQ